MDQHCEPDKLTGKAAVRQNFMNRLETAGLKRPKCCKTEADFDAVKRRLVDFLAYLSPASLLVLADEVLSIAGGKARNEWPAELMVRQMAEALEKRPPEEAPIVTSWMVSIEGPKALVAGTAVEMLRTLRKLRGPLMPYHRKLIEDDARDNRRTRELISERQRHGIDRPEDRHWLAEYAADRQLVETLVARGEQSRAEKQVAGAEQ